MLGYSYARLGVNLDMRAKDISMRDVYWSWGTYFKVIRDVD